MNNTTQEKRQVGIVTGIFLSNLYSTVKMKLFGDTHEKDKEVIEKIQQLKQALDIEHLISKVRSGTLSIMHKELIILEDEVNQQPLLAAVLADMIGKIHEEAALIKRFYYSMRDRPDMVALNQLFNTTSYDQLDSQDASVKSVVSTKTNTLSIVITGYIRSKHTKVYQIHALPHYSNLTTQPVRLDYVGRNLFIRNETNDCIKAIDSAIQSVIEEKCMDANYRDPQLRMWRKHPVVKLLDEPKQSLSILTGSKVLIGCWGSNISIVVSKLTKPVVMKCPINYFFLDASYTFQTSDKMVNHVGGSLRTTETDLQPNVDIHGSHFEDPDHLNDEVEKSLHAIEILTSQRIVATVAGTAITHTHLMYSGLSSLGLLFFCVSLLYGCKRVTRIKISFPVRLKREEPVQVLTPSMVEQATYRALNRMISQSTSQQPARKTLASSASSRC